MADDNQFLKYSRYAIGEIVLVVIGILIAFYINNWFENQETEIQELRYLERLKDDITQDILYYQDRIENLERQIEDNLYATQMAHKHQRNKEELKELLICYSYGSGYLTIQNDTYSEMNNTGNFSIIKNNDLKVAIIRLYRSAEGYAKHIKEYNEFTVSLMKDTETATTLTKYYAEIYLVDTYLNVVDSKKVFYDSEWKFINDPTSYKFRVLENCIMNYIIKHRTLLPYYKILKSDSESIIALINDELKNRH